MPSDKLVNRVLWSTEGSWVFVWVLEASGFGIISCWWMSVFLREGLSQAFVCVRDYGAWGYDVGGWVMGWEGESRRSHTTTTSISLPATIHTTASVSSPQPLPMLQRPYHEHHNASPTSLQPPQLQLVPWTFKIVLWEVRKRRTLRVRTHWRVTWSAYTCWGSPNKVWIGLARR